MTKQLRINERTCWQYCQPISNHKKHSLNKLNNMKTTIILIFLALSEILYAHSGDSIFADTGLTPIIDGEISTGEWDDANMFTFNNDQGAITVYFKHDSNMLYVASDMSDTSYYFGDHFEMRIDADHNEYAGESDDFMLCLRRSGVLEFRQGSIINPDTNGIIWARHSATDKWVIEYSISLARLGLDNNFPETIGVKFENWDDDWFCWPPGIRYENPFADMILYESGSHTSVINNPDANKAILIYPNPSYGNFQIQFSELTNEEVIINLYSQSGQKISCDNLEKHAVEGGLFVNMSSFMPGLYFIQVTTPEKQFIEKIVLQ